MFLIKMAINNIMGHISSLPVHMSAINNTLISAGELAEIRDAVSPTLLTADATSNIT